jgi:putative oxidoreductase
MVVLIRSSQRIKRPAEVERGRIAIKTSEEKIMGFMKAYENQTYALMRITTGFMFFAHGASKFMNMPDERPMHIQWIAGPVELIGGALVMIGLMTSPAAFICAGMGAAAYWMGHFSAENYLPIMNRGDAAALYAFVFLYISAKGTGIWGIGKD